MKAVNLLPRDLRGAYSAPSASGAAEQIPGGPGAFVVLGALALSVAAIAGYVITGNTVRDREAQLAGVTARQQAAQARADKLKPFAEFATVATGRVDAVQKLANTRFDWEQAVRDLSRAIPANVTLSTINGNLGGSSGGAGVALRGAITAPAIELKGCTTDQKSVAALLSRLRAIDGVTRVSLSKSEQQQVAAGTAAPAATDAASATQAGSPCGTGPHPSFEAVVFFGNDAALAAEDVESAAASSTTSATSATAATTSATSPTPATTTSTGKGATR
jgi:Tfp pilus assembly protein PilN